MSFSIHGSSPSLQSNSALELKVAGMVKNQQEREGQMAVELLESAQPSAAPASSSANLGQSINIKV